MERIFRTLDADAEVTELESLCVSCEEQGTTKLLLTRIPFFRDVIVSSFDCPHCHYRNTELTSALEIAESGTEYVLKVNDSVDLNRLIVKSDAASVSIPELELEIPSKTQKGEVTTVEGILNRVITGLRQDQSRRKDEHQEAYDQIEAYIKNIEACISLNTKFSMIIRDISGSSFVANRPDTLNMADSNLSKKQFVRTKEEDHFLGIVENPDPVFEKSEPDETPSDFKDEVLQIPSTCLNCELPCFTKMKVTDIPLFKEVIIMATDCDSCGWKTNEVKSGGGIEPKGKRVKLKVKSKEDLSRDVLKSDSCHVEIPELELQAGGGAIIGKFTTIEGLILDMRDQLIDKNPLVSGDSVDPNLKIKMEEFCKNLDHLLTGQKEFTFILDDPAGNCYIQNVYAPDEDPEMVTEEYERTFEQNEDLGLNDINVGGDQPDL